MGLFRQWFDRYKSKAIFQTHWKLFERVFSRYQFERYDEAVRKMFGWFNLFKFIGRMGQHISPKGMQQLRYYRLHARAVCQKVRKKLTAFLPSAAAQCGKYLPKGVNYLLLPQFLLVNRG
jgi:hypothetical protein